MTALTGPSLFGRWCLLVFAKQVLEADTVNQSYIMAAATKSRLGNLFKKTGLAMGSGPGYPDLNRAHAATHRPFVDHKRDF